VWLEVASKVISGELGRLPEICWFVKDVVKSEILMLGFMIPLLCGRLRSTDMIS